jgi:hypothetical protein
MMKKLFLIVGFFLISWSIKANDLPIAITRVEQSLYAEAEWTEAVIGHLMKGTQLAIEGRDETGVWLLIDTRDKLRGWVATTSNMIDQNTNLYDLPISNKVMPFDTSTIQPITLSTNPDTEAIIERLQSTAIFYNMTTQTVRTIFQHGQAVGNRPDVFTKIGDSNTTSGDFLYPMGLQNQCNLGPFNYLQDTIHYFLASVPNSDKNSFTHSSIAAQKGLSSSAALDPMWAGAGCLSNENPAMCEYHHIKPSIAIIMIGLMDVRYKTSPDLFRSNIQKLVQSSIDQGVIPVLTNIIVLPNQETLSFDVAIQIDEILLDIAEQYNIPLINLWRAVQSLPKFGIGPDQTHLHHVIGSFCDFNGAEQVVGGTLRNLLTLEALDELRREISSE